MSFSRAYMPLQLDPLTPFHDPDEEAQSRRSSSSLRSPRRPVSSGASIGSTSFLLSHAATLSGTVTPPHDFDTSHTFTKFNRCRQVVRLVSWGFLRFMITLTVTLGLYGTIIGFVKYGNMGEVGKKLYNTLFTALSMILGISLASGFKAMALNLRWYILSRKKRPIEEANAILGCSSLTEVSLLGANYAKKKKPGLALSCSLWVLFNIAGQVGVAMLSLTVSLNPFHFQDPNETITGKVVFSNLTQSFADGFFDDDSMSASQLAAHTFGEVALQYVAQTLNFSDPNAFPKFDDADFNTSVRFLKPVQQSQGTLYFVDSKNSYAQYVFQETDANYTMAYLYSNRSIHATSQCTAYSVIDNLNGFSQSFNFTKDGHIHTQPFSSVMPNSTTYFTQPNGGDCGPRCANVCAFENNGSKGWYYECTITVSNVSNTKVPQQRVNDANAKMAAGAIALQGYQATAEDSQYQRYPAHSFYGQFLDGDSSTMASNMRNFAIGVFAAADQSLDDIDPVKLHIEGLLPENRLVQRLSIDHPRGMNAILWTIICCHFVLFVVGTWIANKVIVIDDDYLAIALLLRPIVEEMKDRGALLDGKQRELLGSNMEVIFGPRSSEKTEFSKDGASKLEISTEAEYQANSDGWIRYFDS